MTITLLSVISIWSIAVITPGPNLLITIQTTVNHSRLSGMSIVLGNCTGTIIWAVFGYFGITYLFSLSPWIYITLKIVGGGYLICLGIKSVIILYRRNTRFNEPQNRPQKLFTNWQKGLITNLSNPKTAMFVTSLYASALPQEPSLLIGIMCIMLMTTISLLWYSAVVFLLSAKRFGDFYKRGQDWIQGFAGVVFIAFGMKLVFGNR